MKIRNTYSSALIEREINNLHVYINVDIFWLVSTISEQKYMFGNLMCSVPEEESNETVHKTKHSDVASLHQYRTKWRQVSFGSAPGWWRVFIDTHLPSLYCISHTIAHIILIVLAIFPSTNMLSPVVDGDTPYHATCTIPSLFPQTCSDILILYKHIIIMTSLNNTMFPKNQLRALVMVTNAMQI
jgi:hypothetical protein